MPGGPGTVKQHLPHARPTAGMDTSILVVLVIRTVHADGIGTGGGISALLPTLVVLLLVLLDLLRVALALLVQLLVLGLDLALTVIGVAAAAGTRNILVEMLKPKKKCHIASFNYDAPGDRNSRQLDVNCARRVLAVVEGGVVVQLEATLHAIKVVELDESESPALGRFFLLSCDADESGRVLLEVLLHGLSVGGVGQVTCSMRHEHLSVWDFVFAGDTYRQSR